MKVVVKYAADDGEEFDSQDECETYEQDKRAEKVLVIRVTNRYSDTVVHCRNMTHALSWISSLDCGDKSKSIDLHVLRMYMCPGDFEYAI